MLIATVLALSSIGLLAGAVPANAVELSTDYPVIDVQAGQTVTFDLKMSSRATEQVKLSVTEAPDGWRTDLQGGGFTIGGVYVRPDASPETQLQVQVPNDAEPGEYGVTVSAEAPSGNDTLDLQLRVVTQPSGAFTLTSEFDQLQGSTSDTFDFDLTLANNTGKKATFALAAKGPSGWDVTASPSTQQKASAVEVDAGATATVQLEADPPDSVSAGTYPLAVTAQGQGTTLTAKVKVQVVGSPKLTLKTSGDVLNASGSAGESTDIHLIIGNTGSAPLQDVSLSSSPPSGWEVTFEPKEVGVIPAGKTKAVVAHVVPSGDAITGDYVLTLSANGTDANGSVDIRYTVETSSWWGLVGVVIIALAVVALLWLFRRYGRR